jgi:hypothetical protein
MSKFLKITSVSRTSIEDLFTLGVSTSRGKDDKIGQFGSGTLLGTLAWMRAHNKVAPLFSVNGRVVEFRCETRVKGDNETFDQILINGNPWGVCLDYGVKDWPTPELGLREWISNAIDAGQPFDQILSVVDEPYGNVDEVAIFVPYNDIAKAYHKNLDKYFLFGKYGKDALEKTLVMEKDKPSPCRIFRRGVFVRELEKQSLADYSFTDLSITECRTASSDALEDSIRSRMWYYSSATMAEKIIGGVVQNELDTIETEGPYNTFKGAKFTTCGGLRDEVAKFVGKRGFCTFTMAVANTTPLSENWYNVFVNTFPELDGLKGVTEAEKRKMLIVETPEQLQKFYDLCWTTICSFPQFPDVPSFENAKKRKPKLVFARRIEGSKGYFAGLYSATGFHPEITLVERGESTEADYRVTMIHELCHHFSNSDDGSAWFSDVAHHIISCLMAVLA